MTLTLRDSWGIPMPVTVTREEKTVVLAFASTKQPMATLRMNQEQAAKLAAMLMENA